MIVIEFKKPSVIKQVKRKSDGQQFNIPEQEGWAHIPGMDYPIRVIVSLDRGQDGYPLGKYKLLPASIFVDRNAQLQLKRSLALEPVSASAPRAVAA